MQLHSLQKEYQFHPLNFTQSSSICNLDKFCVFRCKKNSSSSKHKIKNGLEEDKRSDIIFDLLKFLLQTYFYI